MFFISWWSQTWYVMVSDSTLKAEDNISIAGEAAKRKAGTHIFRE